MNGISIALAIHSLDLSAQLILLQTGKMGIHTRCA